MKVVKFPSHGTIFNYYIDSKTKRFVPWSDKIVTVDLDPDTPLQVYSLF